MVEIHFSQNCLFSCILFCILSIQVFKFYLFSHTLAKNVFPHSHETLTGKLESLKAFVHAHSNDMLLLAFAIRVCLCVIIMNAVVREEDTCSRNKNLNGILFVHYLLERATKASPPFRQSM